MEYHASLNSVLSFHFSIEFDSRQQGGARQAIQASRPDDGGREGPKAIERTRAREWNLKCWVRKGVGEHLK